MCGLCDCAPWMCHAAAVHLAPALGLELNGTITRTHVPKRRQSKKNPNERFGFNPPKEEVEETAEVATAATDEPII